jgi:ABC-2 type transport system permease protein
LNATVAASGHVVAAPRGNAHTASALSVFFALLRRDARVARTEIWFFLLRTTMQPLLFVIVFGFLLPKMRFVQGGFQSALLPGILAVSLSLSAIQSVALPMVQDFGWTKEIEDRLLAPVPVWAVAVEKIVIAAARGIIAALLILPLGALILPGGLDLGGASWAGFVAILLAGSVVGASMGLLLGTAVPPNRINIAFTVILTPLLFTGATFYPWTLLTNLRWFQVVTLFNPLTYVSEGTRAALTSIPHLGSGWVTLGLAGSVAIFGALGLLGFERRAVD